MKKEEKDSLREQKLKEKALQINLKAGAVNSFAGGFNHPNITPFALILNTNSFQIGILNALSGILSPLAQLFGTKLMEKTPRKKIVLKYFFLQNLLWIPIAFLAYLSYKNIVAVYLPYLLIAIYLLLIIFSNITAPSSFSWLGDLIASEHKGEILSRRSRIFTLVGIVSSLIGAFLLDMFKTKGLALLGFGVIFLFAFILDNFTYLLLKKQYSPKLKIKKKDYFSFFSFMKRFDNYGKFAFYYALFNFAQMIAGPFFAVYMLDKNQLNFSYTTFMVVSLSSSIFYLLFIPYVGKFSDKYGNKKLLFVGNILFAVNAILWAVIKSPVLLFFIPGIISGLANAAMSLGFTSFTYDAVSSRHRALCSAYQSILLGVGTLLGSLLGGFLVQYIGKDVFNANPFIFVFLISAIIRAVPLIFLNSVKEERKVPTLPPMHVHFTHPLRAITQEVHWFRNVFR